jgi:hypothetical protein
MLIELQKSFSKQFWRVCLPENLAVSIDNYGNVKAYEAFGSL